MSSETTHSKQSQMHDLSVCVLLCMLGSHTDMYMDHTVKAGLEERVYQCGLANACLPCVSGTSTNVVTVMQLSNAYK